MPTTSRTFRQPTSVESRGRAGFMRPWALGAVALALAALLSACNGVPEVCPVGSGIRLSPGALSAKPGSTFRLRSFVTDDDGYYRDTGPGDLVWTSSSPAVVTVASDGRLSAIAPGWAVINASWPSDPTRCAAVFVGVSASPSGEDAVSVAHEDGALVDAVLARAFDGNVCVDLVRGVVLLGHVDKLMAAPTGVPCADEVILFASDREVLQQSVTWSDANDLVPVGPQNPFPNQAPARAPRSLKLALHNWVARDPADDTDVLSGPELAVVQENARRYIKDNLEYASRMFTLNRVGARLEYDLETVDVGPRADLRGCPGAGDAPDWVPPFDGLLHVILVDFLNDADKPARGIACDGPYAHIVMLQNQWARVDILAHELGHALGLRGGQGHTEGVTGFEPHNIMWSDVPTRLQWSVGQVYRMNLDLASWLLTPTPTPATSTCDLAAAPCPALALDLVHTPP